MGPRVRGDDIEIMRSRDPLARRTNDDMECKSPPSPRPPVAGVLRHVAGLGLLADIVFLVVAMALGGVDGNLGAAAGPLVTLVSLGNRVVGFRLRVFLRLRPFLVRR